MLVSAKDGRTIAVLVCMVLLRLVRHICRQCCAVRTKYCVHTVHVHAAHRAHSAGPRSTVLILRPPPTHAYMRSFGHIFISSRSLCLSVWWVLTDPRTGVFAALCVFFCLQIRAFFAEQNERCS